MLEAWKIMIIPNYPNKFEMKVTDPNGRSTRAVSYGEVFEPGTSKLGLSTFISDSARAWNKHSSTLSDIKNIFGAKKETRKIAITLPF